MACGEHPQAADSVGINVFKMRYAGVLISGALGGLGGLVYITAGVSEWKFENGVAGFGFLALAVMIFGQWEPKLIGLAALLFGLFRALSTCTPDSTFWKHSISQVPFTTCFHILSPSWCWLCSQGTPGHQKRKESLTIRDNDNRRKFRARREQHGTICDQRTDLL